MAAIFQEDPHRAFYTLACLMDHSGTHNEILGIQDELIDLQEATIKELASRVLKLEEQLASLLDEGIAVTEPEAQPVESEGPAFFAVPQGYLDNYHHSTPDPALPATERIFLAIANEIILGGTSVLMYLGATWEEAEAVTWSKIRAAKPEILDIAAAFAAVEEDSGAEIFQDIGDVVRTVIAQVAHTRLDELEAMELARAWMSFHVQMARREREHGQVQ